MEEKSTPNHRFYNTLLFIATALILLLVIPKGAKFPYEFKKGTAWLHKNLTAPLDFPIYKTETEIAEEKDSLFKNFTPYFKYDNQIFVENLNRFNKKFELKWAENYKKYYGIDVTDSTKSDKENEKISQTKYAYLNFTSNLLEEIYNKGLIVMPRNISGDGIKDITLTMIRNNIAEEYNEKDFFDIQTAYEYIDKAIHNRREQLPNHENIDANFVDELRLKEFVSPNIVYDEETTVKFRKNMTENVSITRGMVGEGDRIVLKGEIVDAQKLKILNSLKKEYESYITSTSSFYFITLGQFIIVVVCMLAIVFFLLNFRRDIIRDSIKTSFLLLLVVIMVTVYSAFIRFTKINLYIIPLAILPIMIRTFYDTRLALFIHIIAVLIISFFMPNGYEFALLQILVGITAIFTLANVNRREQFFISAIFIILTYSVVFFAISIIQEGDLMKVNYRNLVWFGFNGLLVLSAYPLIYIFEKVFGFLSDVTLMELSDTNHPALRMLAEKAPGTFQHSLQVSNLVEEVMVKIGGNSLLARTGALYHDIGKVNVQQYFIENQGFGNNPHDALEFEESAEIIISHVREGVVIARKYNIPEQIIDFIRTHHGTTKVQYFYRSFIKKYPEKEGETQKFTYAGPVPFSKESSVLMICDSVEAASRSLKIYTEEAIDELVDNIVGSQINNNQLVNSDITFKDINTIKKMLKSQLRNIYHSRIEYPRYEKTIIREPDISYGIL